MLADCLLIVFISICTALLGEGNKLRYLSPIQNALSGHSCVSYVFALCNIPECMSEPRLQLTKGLISFIWTTVNVAQLAMHDVIDDLAT